MSRLTNAFDYFGLTLEESLKRPTLLGAVMVFFLEAFLAGAVAFVLIAWCLSKLGYLFLSAFLIGLTLGLFLFSLYYVAALLSAKVIRNVLVPQETVGLSIGSKAKSAIQLLKFALVSPFLSGNAPSPSMERESGAAPLDLPGWSKGTHLIMPELVFAGQSLSIAEDTVNAHVQVKPVQFDPGRVNLKPLTAFLTLVFGLLGLGLGLALATYLASGIVVPISLRIEAAFWGILIFLVCELPALGLSAMAMGYYKADLYRLEIGPGVLEDSERLPGLLGRLWKVRE